MSLEPVVKKIFLTEIRRECRFGLIAADGLQRALASTSAEATWFYCQSLLDSAGCVSRLLWPSSEKIEGRGLELRTTLAVSDTNPLADRSLRNHFEHFDDRIEAWATSRSAKGFVDSNIMPLRSVSFGMDTADYLRNLDPETLVLTYRGDTYDLKSVIAELQNLLKNVDAAPSGS